MTTINIQLDQLKEFIKRMNEAEKDKHIDVLLEFFGKGYISIDYEKR